MNCNLSNKTCTHPVLHEGLIYEKSTLDKYFADYNKSPTGSEVSEYQQILVKQNIPSTNYSIPNILLSLQNEYDAIVLESYELKQKCQELGKQYSNALYEIDASKRVIARLLKEKETRKDLKITPTVVESVKEMQIDVLLPKTVLDQIEATSIELSTIRRVKVVDFASPEQIKALVPTEIALKGTPSCLDVLRDFILVTIKDGNVFIVRKDTAMVVNSTKVKGEVKFGAFIDAEHIIIAGDVVRIYSLSATKGKTESLKSKILVDLDIDNDIPHKMDDNLIIVTGIAVHPTKKFLLISTQTEFALRSVVDGAELASKKVEGITCSTIHPDGLIYCIGNSAGVSLYEIKSFALATEFAHPLVTSATFSENGYHLATVSRDLVKIWDLRKLSCVWEFKGDDVTACAFDDCGKYVTVLDNSGFSVFVVKKWTLVCKFEVGGNGLGIGGKAEWFAIAGEHKLTILA